MKLDSVFSKIVSIFPHKSTSVSQKEQVNPEYEKSQELCSPAASLATAAMFQGGQQIKSNFVPIPVPADEVPEFVENFNPQLYTIGVFAANINHLEINSVEELLQADVFNDEEKTALKELYDHFDELGYKDFIDAHPKIFQQMATSTFAKFTGLDYGKIEKNEFEVIKHSIELYESGKIKPKWSDAAAARIKDSTPSYVFKYIDDFDSIPEEGIKSKVNPGFGFSKEQIISMLEESKTMRECLDNQSTPVDIKVVRVDDYPVFSNTGKGKHNLEYLLKNGKKDSALKILNNKEKPVSVKYENFIGTTVDCGQEEKNCEGRIVWHIDVPKGSKALFIGGVAPDDAIYSEGEVLLQTNTSLDIKNAEFIDGALHLNAVATQK